MRIGAVMIVAPLVLQAAQSGWYNLTENEAGSNTYFATRLHALNTAASAGIIEFEIQLAIQSKSALPNEIYLADVAIPEASLTNLRLRAGNFDVTAYGTGWKAYVLTFSVDRTSLSYGNNEMSTVTIPLRITFNVDRTLLATFQNDLDPTKLRKWLDDVYYAHLEADVRLDTFTLLAGLSGQKTLYAQYPASTNPGVPFTLKWEMDNELKMRTFDMVNNLLTLTSSTDAVLTDLTLNINYTVPNQNSAQELSFKNNQSRALKANDSFNLSLGSLNLAFLYDEQKHVAFEAAGGHNFFLPEGGSGKYELTFALTVNRAYYTLMVANNFAYTRALNDPQREDYFAFTYAPIYSLSGFQRV